MINLMYHDLTVDGDSSSGFQNTTAFQYKVDVEVFEETLQLLRGREDVTFTFDDGGVSFLTLAASLLERYGRRGVFFISTKYVGTPGFLTSEEVRELERRGHIIGSHSHSHPENITLLSVEEQRAEWEMSRRKLEEMLGHPIELISIPNGYVTAVSKHLFDTLEGIKRIYTSVPTTHVEMCRTYSMHGRYVVTAGMTAKDVVRIVESRGLRAKQYLRYLVLSMAKAIFGNKYDKLKARLMNIRHRNHTNQ